jgi:hypothetical protein
LRISTRSTAAKGIEFRSTAEDFMLCSATRRPLSSTSVLPEPRPRRFALELDVLLRFSTSVAPAISVFEARLSSPLPLAEMKVIISSALKMPARSICSRVITWSGNAPSVCMRLMLLPVTSMRSPLAACWA